MSDFTQFNPETAGKDFNPEGLGVAFNPEMLGSGVSHQDQLNAVSNKILSGNFNKNDEKAYKSAYVDSPNHTLWESTKDTVGGFVSNLPKIGGAILGMAQNAVKSAQSNKPPVIGFNENTPGAADVAARESFAKGALTGVKNFGADAIQFGMNGLEAFNNTIARNSSNPMVSKKAREDAAEMSLNVLRMKARSQNDLSNPHQPGTPESKAWDVGNMAGQLGATALVPFVGEAFGAAGKVAQTVTDVGANVAAKTAGLAMRAAPALANTTGAAAIAASPKTIIWDAVKGLLKGPEASGLGFFAQGNAERKGLWTAVGEAGKTVTKTPVGKSAFKNFLDSSPDIMKKLQTDNISARLEVSAAEAQLKDAVENGFPQTQFKAGLKKAQKNYVSTVTQQNVMDKGIKTLQWLNDVGATGLSSKLADATSGALQTAFAMHSLNAFGQTPGKDPSVDSDAQAAILGAFLGVLGTAAHSAHHDTARPSDLRQAANERAIYPTPVNQPPILEQFGAKPKKPVPPTTNTAIIDGAPVNQDKLAEAIQSHATAAGNAAAAASGHTFDFTQRKARGSAQYDFEKIPDAHLTDIANKSVPVNSSWLERISYDPEKQVGLFKTTNPNNIRKGVSTYSVPGLTPEKFDGFMQGLNSRGMVEANNPGSHGKYFNSFIKQYENHWRIKDDVWTPPAAKGSINPVISPLPTSGGSSTNLTNENPQASNAGRSFNVSPTERGGDFFNAIARTAKEHPRSSSVEVKSPDFYQDPANKLFLSQDGLAGAAVKPDGDLVSVFKHQTSGANMADILSEASSHATKLDAFDIKGFLPSLYSKHGFRPVARVAFADEHAPLNWNFEKDGRPDVVLMVRDSKNKLKLPDATFYNKSKNQVPLVSYDEASKLQQSALDKLKQNIPRKPKSK